MQRSARSHDITRRGGSPRPGGDGRESARAQRDRARVEAGGVEVFLRDVREDHGEDSVDQYAVTCGESRNKWSAFNQAFDARGTLSVSFGVWGGAHVFV